MKKHRLGRIQNRALLASLLAVHGTTMATTVAPGTLINVDFDSTSGSHGHKPAPVTFDGDMTNALSAASVAYEDADAAVNDQWNGFEITATQPGTLFDSTGQPTSLTVTWSGFTFGYTNWSNVNDGNGFTNGPNADGFYGGASNSPGLVTIGGLDPAKTYNVAAIAAGDPVSLGIGVDSQILPSWNRDTNASNWVLFSNLVPLATALLSSPLPPQAPISAWAAFRSPPRAPSRTAIMTAFPIPTRTPTA